MTIQTRIIITAQRYRAYKLAERIRHATGEFAKIKEPGSKPRPLAVNETRKESSPK